MAIDPHNLSFSLRQRQVQELIAQGFCDKEIGYSLNISRNTIATHLRRIYRKMGLSGGSSRVLLALAVKASRYE
jgi:DNA-binding NarL/FixJ family response regulator